MLKDSEGSVSVGGTCTQDEVVECYECVLIELWKVAGSPSGIRNKQCRVEAVRERNGITNDTATEPQRIQKRTATGTRTEAQRDRKSNI